MANPKKLKDYLKLGMRKLKHRKGFGVHSPFAYAIITEVIEEKLPYYAYRRMQRTYDRNSSIPFKVACLLLRLANRFRVRNAAEIGCDGGFSILPLILTDTQLQVRTYASAEAETQAKSRLAWLPARIQQVSFLSQLSDLDAAAPYDMLVINENPFLQTVSKPTPEELDASAAQLLDWVMAHVTDNTVIFVHGILPRHRLESFWDSLCDRDDVSITMDLYDFGLAILKPRFFKQHYIVSF